MAEGYIQLPDNSTGKKIRTFTDSASTVPGADGHKLAMMLADAGSDNLFAGRSEAPGASDFGLVVRPYNEGWRQKMRPARPGLPNLRPLRWYSDTHASATSVGYVTLNQTYLDAAGGSSSGTTMTPPTGKQWRITHIIATYHTAATTGSKWCHIIMRGNPAGSNHAIWSTRSLPITPAPTTNQANFNVQASPFEGFTVSQGGTVGSFAIEVVAQAASAAGTLFISILGYEYG